MPTKAACPKEVAPPTPVSRTRPSATSAPTPMSLSSETAKLPSTSGAAASSSTTAPSSKRRGFIGAPYGAARRSPRGGASALGAARRRSGAPYGAARRSPRGGASALGAARRRSSIDLLGFFFRMAGEEGAQHQHRDQQAEHDHVLQRTAPERREALHAAHRERADRRERVAHQAADDGGDEGLEA